MDEKYLELAAETEQRERDAGVARAIAANKPQYHPDFDGTHCVDCYSEVHPKRLEAGKVRCTNCQEIEDQREQYRR